MKTFVLILNNNRYEISDFMLKVLLKYKNTMDGHYSY